MVAKNAQAVPLVLLFHVTLFKNVRIPPQNQEIQLFIEEKYKFLFTVRYFRVLVYKIRFSLLRTAGNIGCHCNSTWFCLCGVGLLTLLEKLQSSPSRQTLPGCSSSGQAEVTPVQQVLVPQPLSSPCSAPAGLRLPERPWGPAGSWETPNGAGLRWGGQTVLPTPAHQLCPHPQQQWHLPTQNPVVSGTGKPSPLPTGLEFAELNC